MSRKAPSRAGLVVKLGGSVITDKRGDRPRIRRQVLARLAAELAQAPRGKLLAVVHGAGSFGHGPVLRAGIHRGARTSAQRQAWARIQVLQNELDAEVCRALQEAGIPATPCQASAAAVLDDRQLAAFWDDAVRGMVAERLVPVLYGVPAVDRRQGCAILSGDVLAPELAARLGAARLVLATDVDGVFDADPHRDAAARPFPRVTPANWAEVEAALGGSRAADVTGGMRRKLKELLGYVGRHGFQARIVDANQPGRLRDAVRGRAVGTLVQGT